MKIRICFLDSNYNFIAEAAASSQLEKNFKLSELANNAGDKSLPQYEVNIGSILLVSMLQQLRDKVKKPIMINSGYRQEEYNKKIGGDAHSPHLKGWAADIQKISGYTDGDIATIWRQLCCESGTIGAINLYGTYYHLEIMSDVNYGSTKFEVRDHRSNVKKGAKR